MNYEGKRVQGEDSSSPSYCFLSLEKRKIYYFGGESSKKMVWDVSRFSRCVTK